MAQEKVYPGGIRAFSPRSGAPDFVKGSLVITPRELVDWLKANGGHMTEYEGKKQLRLDILEGNKGLYVAVNTFKPEEKKESIDDSSDLPF